MDIEQFTWIMVVLGAQLGVLWRVMRAVESMSDDQRAHLLVTRDRIAPAAQRIDYYVTQKGSRE